MSRDPRIDTYIARQRDFARPILEHLRKAVHAACPEAEETLKWSAPAFAYKGKTLAMMAAFKQHATLSFWRGAEVLGEDAQDGAMGQFGRLQSLADLPSEEKLAELIRKTMEMIESGASQKRTAISKPEVPVPEDFQTAMDADGRAAAAFRAFPPSCRREYVEWVVDAKRPGTREKRITQSVEWLTEGKKRNWKYEKC
jgi:uncharacterized protein YdeI (YjbR/CyaY-like superfamily)